MRSDIPILNPYADLFEKIRELEASPQQLLSIRRKLVAAYAWAIPSRLALETIKRYGPVFELGAGTGYWAFCLKQIEVDILAFDRNSNAPPHWSRISEGDDQLLADPASPLHERSLMLCWPPLNEPMALHAIQLYRGDTVIDIGEPKGGNTGSLEFTEKLERDFSLAESLPLPRWPSCQDELRVWLKNSR
jgi:hypothetical protein